MGGNLLRRLQLTETPWVELLRSNRRNLDPVFFAVYGEVVYHHGSGFRKGSPSGIHRSTEGPTNLTAPSVPLLGKAVGAINGRRWRSWEARTQERRLELSQSMYERIGAGGREWLEELI